MKVFKFGGASIKNADAIKNVIEILHQYSNDQIFIVVSAIDKTTNALEKVVQAFFAKEKNISETLQPIINTHQEIANHLGISFSEVVEPIIEQLKEQIEAAPSVEYDEFYDRIVAFGERISLNIIFNYLKICGYDVEKIDAERWVKTDNFFRFAKVDLQLSESLIKNFIHQNSQKKFFITQGFVGSTLDHRTTTLGREGSDYTAALVGAFLNADSVTVWKDVLGLLDADPKYIPNAKKLSHISYSEAIELAYYGAKVIHPKTIKPLENTNIPLFVRSFIHKEDKGTIIDNHISFPKKPSIIFHENQMLMTISVKDMSFITEAFIHDIFGILAQCRIKVNLMQNSALSLSLCIDDDPMRTETLIQELSKYYYVRFNTNLQLISIRYYTKDTIKKFLKDKEILLEQRSRIMAQFVIK